MENCTEFAPFRGWGAAERSKIITLPASIGRLQSVKKLILYGSNLVRIPPEIGNMESLEEFDPYTSYGLHWFPYEITRCRALTNSRVSTRALYGNFKLRPGFPDLSAKSEKSQEIIKSSLRRHCSVCNKEFQDQRAYRVWISLQVATDVLPLLVNACSRACLDALPTPAEEYVRHPHQGGASLKQPPTEF